MRIGTLPSPVIVYTTLCGAVILPLAIAGAWQFFLGEVSLATAYNLRSEVSGHETPSVKGALRDALADGKLSYFEVSKIRGTLEDEAESAHRKAKAADMKLNLDALAKSASAAHN